MFIAKNNDLIILAKNTRAELEQALQFMVYTSVEETEIEYELYNGEYLTQAEIATKERARKDTLTLTPADVWRALYKAKSMTQTQLLTLIETQMTGIDIEAIKIEFGASLFYRGAKFGNNKMFDVIGNLLGYTSNDMDYLFEHKELPEQEIIDYSQYTVAELKAMADEMGLSYASNILKADLIALLEANE